MSQIKIADRPYGTASKIKSLASISDVIAEDWKSKILLIDIDTKISKDFSFSSKIEDIDKKIKIVDSLPFRVKFFTIGLSSSYGPGNAAPIGIAVIGMNNYVM